jgi:hypothetical protein
MIFNVENTRGRKVRVRDENGVVVPHVRRYDSQTRVAEVYMANPDGTLTTRWIQDPSGGERRDIVPIVEVDMPGSTIEVDGVVY